MDQNAIVLVVSVSIIHEDKILMIKEKKPTAFNKWNFPSGRIEPGEEILAAAYREVKEETGFEVLLTSTTGVYHFISNTNHQVILFHFIGEIIGGSLKLQEDEILDYKWLSLKEINGIEKGDLREPVLMDRILDSLREKRFYPLSVFNELLSMEDTVTF
jgi:8-oxo-dGTP diphosphatase